MELAKAWCRSNEPCCPDELRLLLESHPFTHDAVLLEGVPERVTPLPFRGEGRNHDLWIRAEIAGTPLTVCVEAKADEPFGDRIGKYLSMARKQNQRTGTERRARQLLQLVVGRDVDPFVEPFASLRYQRLTAVAGTVLQAVSDGAWRAVLVVHEFKHPRLDPAQQRSNEADLFAFLSVLEGAPIDAVVGKLLEPWLIVPNAQSGKAVELLVGKIVTELIGT